MWKLIEIYTKVFTEKGIGSISVAFHNWIYFAEWFFLMCEMTTRDATPWQMKYLKKLNSIDWCIQSFCIYQYDKSYLENFCFNGNEILVIICKSFYCKMLHSLELQNNFGGYFLKYFFANCFCCVLPPAVAAKCKHFGRERITFRAGKCIHKIANYYGLMMILYDLVKMTSISNII